MHWRRDNHRRNVKNSSGGSFKHLLISPLLAEDSHFDNCKCMYIYIYLDIDIYIYLIYSIQTVSNIFKQVETTDL